MTNLAFVLRVYVANGKGPSDLAVRNLKKICDDEVPGRYTIEVVDVSKNLRAAIENNLIALPMVIRTLPAPIRKFVGNWADKDYHLLGLQLTVRDEQASAKRSRSARSSSRHANSV